MQPRTFTRFVSAFLPACFQSVCGWLATVAHHLLHALLTLPVLPDAWQAQRQDSFPASAGSSKNPLLKKMVYRQNWLFVAGLLTGCAMGLAVQAQTISTVAGSDKNGDGGVATSASLSAPYGVALDGSGNLFIADRGNNRIRRVDGVTGVITTVAGDGSNGFSGDGGVATSASLSAPYGVALDGGGNLFIADQGNNRIRRVDGPPSLMLMTQASPNPVCAGSTAALSVTASGGTTPYSYTWAAPAGITLSSTSTSAVSASVGATVSGTQTFTITVASAGGSPSSTSLVSVTVNAAPSLTITANPSLTINSGNTVTLTASGATSYMWSSGQTTAAISVSPTSTTAYSVTGTSSGCSSMSSVTVTVVAPVAPLVITSLSPSRNARSAPAATSVGLTFDQALSTDPASLTTVRVFSAQRGGLLRQGQGGTASVSGSTLSFAPTTGFRPGETVLTTVLGTLQSSSGASLGRGQVQQFTVETGGTGRGNFTAPLTNPNPSVGSTPQSVAVGDLDGDGDLDLLTANTGSNTVSVRFNDGTGNFTVPATNAEPFTGVTPQIVALGDLDGDGDLDLLTANSAGNSVSVRLNQPLLPTITGFAASPAPACAGSVVNFTATVGNVTGNYNYTLTNGSSPLSGTVSSTAFSQTLVASGSGPQTFTLTVAQNGVSTKGTTGLTVNSMPTNASLTSGTLTCAATSVTLRASATGGSSYSFSAGAVQIGTTNKAVVSTAGTYSVIIANANGCTVTATSTVESNTTAPTATLTSSGTLTCNQTSVTLTATGGTSYTLSNGQTNTTGVFSVSTAGTYTVTVSNANSCTATATTTVESNMTAPTATLTSSGTLTCATTSVTLTASGGTSYSLSNGQTNTTGVFSVSTAGTYTVTVGNADGCTATATVSSNTIAPTATLMSSGTLTCSVTSVTLAASGGMSYTLSDGQSNSTGQFVVSTAGTYTVTVSNANGCMATATATVESNTAAPTNASLTSGTLTCATTSVTLTASATGGTSYTLSDGQTNTTGVFSVSTAGTYTVTVSNANGCTATATSTVESNTTAPTATLTSNGTLTCAATSVTLTATGGTSYALSDGQTNTTGVFSVSTAGT